MTMEADNAATAAILAHGALNSLTAVSAAIELLAETAAGDEPLAVHVVDLARSQMGTLVDSLRLIAMGLPSEAREELDALDDVRTVRHPIDAELHVDLDAFDGGMDLDAPFEAEPRDRREQARADTRRMVQEASLRLAEEQGFDRTSVSDIAAASFISTRTFFRHFASKQEAIWSWVEDEGRRLAASVLAVPPDYVDDADVMRRATRSYAAGMAEREAVAGRYIALISSSESFSRLGLEQTAVAPVAEALARRRGEPSPTMEQRALARVAAAAVAVAMEEFHLAKGQAALPDLILESVKVVLPGAEER